MNGVVKFLIGFFILDLFVFAIAVLINLPEIWRDIEFEIEKRADARAEDEIQQAVEKMVSHLNNEEYEEANSIAQVVRESERYSSDLTGEVIAFLNRDPPKIAAVDWVFEHLASNIRDEDVSKIARMYVHMSNDELSEAVDLSAGLTIGPYTGGFFNLAGTTTGSVFGSTIDWPATISGGFGLYPALQQSIMAFDLGETEVHVERPHCEISVSSIEEFFLISDFRSVRTELIEQLVLAGDVNHALAVVEHPTDASARARIWMHSPRLRDRLSDEEFTTVSNGIVGYLTNRFYEQSAVLEYLEGVSSLNATQKFFMEVRFRPEDREIGEDIAALLWFALNFAETGKEDLASILFRASLDVPIQHLTPLSKTDPLLLTLEGSKSDRFRDYLLYSSYAASYAGYYFRVSNAVRELSSGEMRLKLRMLGCAGFGLLDRGRYTQAFEILKTLSLTNFSECNEASIFYPLCRSDLTSLASGQTLEGTTVPVQESLAVLHEERSRLFERLSDMLIDELKDRAEPELVDQIRLAIAEL